MKKFLALLLILTIFLGLAACSQDTGITYYYVRNKLAYQYGTADGVMVGESREAASHADDLRYLLILYFHGPFSDNLESPFPGGTRLEEMVQTEDELHIRLSGAAASMEGTELTLACACLARTCFGLTDVRTVTISAEADSAVSMTFTRDSLLLVDDSAEFITDESQ